MVLSENKKKEYIKRLLMSRMRLLLNHGFYGLLLMHIKYALDENCETAATDGRRIWFSPKFLEELSDSELDFVMMHEILHVVLQHCMRQGDRNKEQFNIACDIVVNSIILQSNKMDRGSITLKQYGESMHLAPDGKEGYEYTAEQVYEMLPQKKQVRGTACCSSGGETAGASNKGQGLSSSGCGDDCNGREDGDSKNLKGTGSSSNGCGKSGSNGRKTAKGKNSADWDDHDRWGTAGDADDFEELKELWEKHLEDTCKAISIRDPSNIRGTLPLFAERIIKSLRNPQTDWRTILNDFVQEEIVDYSFAPPDRRFDDSPFFLPDFNLRDDSVKDILFMIDASGSMSDEMITAAYSEVKGAIDQFDGKLKGWLGFFDAAIVEPKPFESVEEFLSIRPNGGGGTDFEIIFDYVAQNMSDQPPVSIIILTDGYAPFPREEKSMGIPVLWLLNNKEVNPPWGKIAEITL